MLAFGIRRLNDQIHDTTGDSYLSCRDRSPGNKLLRLANHDTPRVVRRLGDCERIRGNRLFFHGAISVLVDTGGAKDADVNLEASIEHELLTVQRLDRDVVGCVVTGRLVDFPGFEPGIDESAEANTREVSRPARCN